MSHLSSPCVYIVRTNDLFKEWNNYLKHPPSLMILLAMKGRRNRDQFHYYCYISALSYTDNLTKTKYQNTDSSLSLRELLPVISMTLVILPLLSQSTERKAQQQQQMKTPPHLHHWFSWWNPFKGPGNAGVLLFCDRLLSLYIILKK